MYFLPWKSASASLAAILLAGLSGAASAKGISVRFLACPPEDSIVRYEVYRSDSAGGSAKAVGVVPASPGSDTLGFRDLSAEKGRPYFYAIKGINAGGVASDPSAQTQVGYPLLSLPDTLRPDQATGATRAVLAPHSDPLLGSAPLVLSLADSARFSVAYDPASRTAAFRSRSGKADTGRVVVRAQYFGKFEDRDTVLILVSATGSAASLPRLPGAPAAGAARSAFPSRYSPLAQGPLSLSGLPGPGSLEILTALGARARVLELPGPRARLLWDGRDHSGLFLRPARYLWAARGPGGSVLETGSFLILP
ncbi:MAG TPA: hypothetical protein VJ385_16035 [Fibrobacteria bacterium]|nr:hypothetical protein [Fibrobacteria bacterium]